MNMKEIVLYVRVGILIDQNWQSAIGFEVSRYSNLSFSKTTILKFLSRSGLMVIYFQLSSDGIISVFIPQIAILIG